MLLGSARHLPGKPGVQILKPLRVESRALPSKVLHAIAFQSAEDFRLLKWILPSSSCMMLLPSSAQAGSASVMDIVFASLDAPGHNELGKNSWCVGRRCTCVWRVGNLARGLRSLAVQRNERTSNPCGLALKCQDPWIVTVLGVDHRAVLKASSLKASS